MSDQQKKKKKKVPPSDKGHKYEVLPPHPGIDCSQIGIHPSQQLKNDTGAVLEKEWKIMRKYSTRRFFQNTVGPIDSILTDPEHTYSEWGTLRLWAQNHEWKKLAKLGSYSFGSLACPILTIPLLFKVKQRASKITTVPDPNYEPFYSVDLGHHNHDDEAWIFLNGACTTKELHYANGMHLADVFKRKIHLLHNPTQGLMIDLLEWFVSKPMNDAAGLAQQLGWLMKDYLYSFKVKKVVLIAHSQGSILCSYLIQYLIMEGLRNELSKLEVYTVGASATDFFQVYDPITNSKVPYYEHYANSGDYFARMGVLHKREAGENPVPGNVFVMYREGHLFGEHYLSGIQAKSYKCLNLPGLEPRLYKYLPQN